MNNKDFNSEDLDDSFKDQLKGLIEKYSRPSTEVLLDDVDLRNLLKISRRTALEYRKKKVFPYYKLDNKIYYILAEVIEGIKQKGGVHGN